MELQVVRWKMSGVLGTWADVSVKKARMATRRVRVRWIILGGCIGDQLAGAVEIVSCV